MAECFAQPMQQDQAVERPAVARDARHDAVVRTLRDRAAEDRDARAKRQRWYRQSLPNDPSADHGDAGADAPVRRSRSRTKVPCRTTPDARALLDDLARRYPGSTVTFPQASDGRRAVMLSRVAGTPRQVGWLEHHVEADPARCGVRHQGLTVETDGASLRMRFRYPATAVRVSSAHDADSAAPSRGVERVDGLPSGSTGDHAAVEFTELRPVLDLRAPDVAAPPRLVWLTRPEVETMAALRSRDYEAFYLRFKLEVQAGVWRSLASALARAPGSRWHAGSHLTVARVPDATSRRIHQRTIDDGGRAVDIGWDRTYDAASATDILLLYLDGDVLADVADICFTLQCRDAVDALSLKEELFSTVRRFWTRAESLASRFGGDVAAVVRMSQRAVPAPAQIPQLRQDWINLRQALLDRYGEAGRNAGRLVAREARRPFAARVTWPFATFPAGDVDVGLRLVYRQEWTHLGVQRGNFVRTVAAAATHGAAATVETIVEPGDAGWKLREVVDDVLAAAAGEMQWPLALHQRADMGLRALGSGTAMGLEAECRDSGRETTARIDEVMVRMARRIHDGRAAGTNAAAEARLAAMVERGADADAATYSCSRLQHRCEVVTRLAAVENVVLVAERLPAPAEIDDAWARRHAATIARVLLDESLREALVAVGEEPSTRDSRANAAGARDATRERLCEHLRANVLHYQQAVWRHEDPQQRSMRYRKSGRKVPLEWRFELEVGAGLTIEELAARLAASDIDGQFVAYSTAREAYLDEVIDPAGPIGYHGTYAVYRMRAELGSADLFSMLHFFKSPWLRPNAETGVPEVDDSPQRRTSRVALDTNGLVIDVVRRVEAATAKPADARIDCGTGGDEHRLLLDGTRCIRPLSANGHRGFTTEAPIVDGERASRLVVGVRSRVERTRAADAHESIVASGGTARRAALRAGRHHDPQGDPAIVGPEGRGGAPELRAGTAHDAAERSAVLAGGDGQATLIAVAGVEARQAHEPAVVPAAGHENGPRLHAGAGTLAAHPQPVLAAGDAARRSALHAGQKPAAASEPAIFARVERALRVARVADAGARAPREPAIIVRDDAMRLPGRAEGDAATATCEWQVLAPCDGEAPRLLAGSGSGVTGTRDAGTGRLVLVRDDGALQLGAARGAVVAGVPPRPIVPWRDGRPSPRLIAGTGRAQARLILVRDDGRVRASMIAVQAGRGTM